MAVFNALNGLLGADASGWNKTLDGAAAKAEEFADKSKKAFDKANNASDKLKNPKPGSSGGEKGSWLERLAANERKEAREKSKSGESALEGRLRSGEFFLDKMGMGGVRGVVTDYVGKSFANVTSKAVEVRDALQSGAQDWKGAANEIAQTIPVLGGFVQGFNNVRELVTGERAAIEALKKETASHERVNDAIQKRLDMVKQLAKDYAALDTAIAAQDRAVASMQMTGFGKSKFDIESGVIAKRAALEQQREAAIEKSNAGFNTAIAALVTEKNQATDEADRNRIIKAIEKTQLEKATAAQTLDAKYGALDLAAVRMGQQQQHDVIVATQKKTSDMRLALESEYFDNVASVRDTALRANEMEVTASIESLSRNYRKQADSLIEGTRERIRALGFDETRGVGKDIFDRAIRNTQQLEQRFGAERAALLASNRKAIMDGLRTPEEKFADDLARLQKQYEQGVLSATDLAKAKAKFTENAAKSLVESVETPAEKYARTLKDISSQFKNKLIDPKTQARLVFAAGERFNQEQAARSAQPISALSFDSRTGLASLTASTVAPMAEVSKEMRALTAATLAENKLTQQQLAEEARNVNARQPINF